MNKLCSANDQCSTTVRRAALGLTWLALMGSPASVKSAVNASSACCVDSAWLSKSTAISQPLGRLGRGFPEGATAPLGQELGVLGTVTGSRELYSAMTWFSAPPDQESVTRQVHAAGAVMSARSSRTPSCAPSSAQRSPRSV